MLSRVADSLYWMARNIERAENLSRLIDVNLQLLLDYQNPDPNMLQDYWESILQSTDSQHLFKQLYDQENSSTVTEFLTSHPENPNSIAKCIQSARENARMVRDQISDELWQEINSLYLSLGSAEAQQMRQANPYDFYQNIRQSSLLIQGIAGATISRDQGYEFVQLGQFLERADKTTRILDTVTYLHEPANDTLRGLDSLQWVAILRSCSAYGAYRSTYGGEVLPDNVLNLLVFSAQFPRSVRFCAQQIDNALHHISGVGPNYFSNDAERHSGICLSKLNFGSIDDINSRGLHEYLDDLQTIFNLIGKGIFDTYVLLPDSILHEGSSRQQQQQQ